MKFIPTDSSDQLYRPDTNYYKKVERKDLGLLPALTELLHF